MKCRFCRRELSVRGYRTHSYRDATGRVTSTRRSPIYHRCECRAAVASPPTPQETLPIGGKP